jgi:hypothetical protein
MSDTAESPTGEQTTSFEEALTNLINYHSEENRSNTPDWILCWYIRACLDAFNRAVHQREVWFGRESGDGGCVLLPVNELDSAASDLVDIVGGGEEGGESPNAEGEERDE